jgi:hypothetical protein
MGNRDIILRFTFGACRISNGANFAKLIKEFPFIVLAFFFISSSLLFRSYLPGSYRIGNLYLMLSAMVSSVFAMVVIYGSVSYFLLTAPQKRMASTVNEEGLLEVSWKYFDYLVLLTFFSGIAWIFIVHHSLRG